MANVPRKPDRAETGPPPTPDASRYIARLEALIGDREPVAILDATPEAASRLLESLRRDERDRPEAPGRWSARDVILHLLDAETVYAERLRVMITADGVEYPPFDQERRLTRLRVIVGGAADALSEFRHLRAGSMRWIEALASDDLARTGIHPSRGRESVSQLIRRWAGHDLVHLAQLARITRLLQHSPGT